VITERFSGLAGGDPLGFLAALGLLRVVSKCRPDALLKWHLGGTWVPELSTEDSIDILETLLEEADLWRSGHPAIDFADTADTKVQDLKHPPEGFRAVMREAARDHEASAFIAAYGTGVAADGTGQNKPTALHFCAGQQRFMAAVRDIVRSVERADFEDALAGPGVGRVGPKDLRWRAASERSRALLGFDPSKEKSATAVGAVWLAIQSLPLFPVVPVGRRAVTTGFTGRGHQEHFTWPIWSVPIGLDAARSLLATPDLAETTPSWRTARGVALVFRSAVVRSAQGYGNFAAPGPT